MNLPEAGYTPANLRALLKQAGLTQMQAAALLDPPASSRSINNWCADTDNANHRDMPLVKWRELLQLLSHP